MDAHLKLKAKVNVIGSASDFTYKWAINAGLPEDDAARVTLAVTEVVTNVVRHARAARARVELICDNGVAQLQVSDDGVGFDPTEVLEGGTQLGWGLVGIRERVQMAGGECRIESSPGEGTNLMVRIPLPTWKEQQ